MRQKLNHPQAFDILKHCFEPIYLSTRQPEGNKIRVSAERMPLLLTQFTFIGVPSEQGTESWWAVQLVNFRHAWS